MINGIQLMVVIYSEDFISSHHSTILRKWITLDKYLSYMNIDSLDKLKIKNVYNI